MRAFAIALLLCGAAVAALAAYPLSNEQYETMFYEWTATNNKTYESQTEMLHRFLVWKSNLDYISSQNEKNLTYTLAMNAFGDLTNEEFVERYNGYNFVRRDHYRKLNTKKFHTTAIPDSWDCTAQGKLVDIKDQGQCGSCWAFSATAAIESAYAIENSVDPISLSEQQLVDCSTSFGNQGCNGGLMDQAFEYVEQTAQCTEADYPYTGTDGTCNTGCTGTIQITGFTDVTPNDENQLAAAVYQQPVSVAVEADGADWQFYSGGIISDACGTNLDHGVVAVGYGTDAGTAYWKVRNSWGASWGEAGYVRLARGTNECGIAMDPSYPTGAKKVA